MANTRGQGVAKGEKAMIYMVRVGEVGPIKIGWAKNVRRRVETLQTSHPVRLIVVREKRITYHRKKPS